MVGNFNTWNYCKRHGCNRFLFLMNTWPTKKLGENENLIKFFKQFEDWLLWDIKFMLKLEDENGNIFEPDRKTYKLRRPFVATVILMCCAIDTLAAFRYGRKNSDVGKTFEKFIQEYFRSDITKSGKSYNVKHVYNSLRNALLHGYSLGKDLALGHTDEGQHLERLNDRVIVDVFMLYFDLEAVYRKYKQELESGQHLDEFKVRWNFAPLIRYIPEENLKR